MASVRCAMSRADAIDYIQDNANCVFPSVCDTGPIGTSTYYDAAIAGAIDLFDN